MCYGRKANWLKLNKCIAKRRVSRATFGSNHPDTLDCLHKLAESLWPQKNCVEVEELFCEAIHR